MILAQFQTVGQDLFTRGLVPAHSGDLSIRLADRIIISRRASALAHLTDQDLVETGVERNGRATPAASPELPVHRAVYRQTEAQAIIHAYPAHAGTLAMVWDEIIPIDALGIRHFERVPVLARTPLATSREAAHEIAAALQTSKVVLVRGYGCFAVGQLLEECHQWISCLEESCRLLWLLETMGHASPRQGTRVLSGPSAPALP